MEEINKIELGKSNEEIVSEVDENFRLLKEQAGRIAEIPEHCFPHPLPFKFPVEGIDTFGDLYNLMLHHEAEHLGQMKAMKRVIQA